MAISKSWLDKFDELVTMADETCTCEVKSPCMGCESREKLEEICILICSAVENIKSEHK